jgi:hypothetical protein
MITNVIKPAIVSRGPAITLLAQALPVILALMLGLTALALLPPAGASAQTLKTQDAKIVGNQHEGGAPQLYVSEPKAAKPDGEKQPLDLSVELTDQSGNPIEGAKVMARATDFQTFVDAPLTDMGNGRYTACAFGYFNGSGEGALRIHIRAEKTGYRAGAGDGSNSVGRLCKVSGTESSR